MCYTYPNLMMTMYQHCRRSTMKIQQWKYHLLNKVCKKRLRGLNKIRLHM